MTGREADFGMKPTAPRSRARVMLSRSSRAERTTTAIPGWLRRSSLSNAKPSASGSPRSSSTSSRSVELAVALLARSPLGASTTVASGRSSFRTPRKASLMRTWSSTTRMRMQPSRAAHSRVPLSAVTKVSPWAINSLSRDSSTRTIGCVPMTSNQDLRIMHKNDSSLRAPSPCCTRILRSGIAAPNRRRPR